jgi:hypothetical protein
MLLFYAHNPGEARKYLQLLCANCHAIRAASSKKSLHRKGPSMNSHIDEVLRMSAEEKKQVLAEFARMIGADKRDA